jgi:hypothetical protein
MPNQAKNLFLGCNQSVLYVSSHIQITRGPYSPERGLGVVPWDIRWTL